MHDHPFIQEIIQTKGKPVILYLKVEEGEIKMLEVVRTFNRSLCYVTILCYQQNNLCCKSTQNHPVMPGRVNGLYPTYHAFFLHLTSQMNDMIYAIQVGGRNLLVRSNEENVLTKAIQQSFPLGHIEKNVKCHLHRKVGVNHKQIKAVMNDIFETMDS